MYSIKGSTLALEGGEARKGFTALENYMKWRQKIQKDWYGRSRALYESLHFFIDLVQLYQHGVNNHGIKVKPPSRILANDIMLASLQ